MRALLFISVLLVSTSTIYAQKTNHTLLAQEHYHKKEYEKAKNQINLAIQDKKLSKKVLTWIWMGKIYYSLATLSETPSSSSDKVRFNRVSVNGYKRAISLDKRGKKIEGIHKTMSMMNSVFLNEGLISYNSKDYTNAAFYFELSAELATTMELTDTNAIFNAGLAYEKLKKLNLAVERYTTCANLNYGGPVVYEVLYSLLLISQKRDEASKVLLEGIEKYPSDIILIRSQLTEYLKSKEATKALELINNAIIEKPEVAELYIMRGSLKEKLKMNGSEIITDYQKAIDLQENYFDGNQKMGLYYYNLGLNTIKSVRSGTLEISLDEENDSSGKVELKKGIPYLEKALALKFYDRKTLEALKNLYAHLEMPEEHERVSALLNN